MRPQYIIDEAGIKKSVIIPMDEYEELIEDIHDLAILAERKDELPISLEELKNRLKTNGLIQD